MANKGFFDNLKHQLGGSPAPDDVIKAKDNKKSDPKPEDVPKDDSKGDTLKQDTPKDNQDKTPDQPEDDGVDIDTLLNSLDGICDADDESDDRCDDNDNNKSVNTDEDMSSSVGNVGATVNPLNPHFPKKGGKRNMKMRDRDFYDRIGDLAYYHDRGDEGDYSELDAYMKEYKTESLSETDLIKEIDANLEADYDRFSALLLDRIANAETHRPDPVKRLFVNKIDTNDITEYETFDQALTSVKDNPYVTDPKSVFEQIWRQVKADGSLGEKVSEQEVRKYADTLNAKNKSAFLSRMGLPEQKQNHQKQNSGKPDKGKGNKDKGNKPKSDNGSDNSNSSNAGNGSGGN